MMNFPTKCKFNDRLAIMGRQLKHRCFVRSTTASYEAPPLRMKHRCFVSVHSKTLFPAYSSHDMFCLTQSLITQWQQSSRISVLEPAHGIKNRLSLPPDVSRVGRKIALVPQGEPEPEARNYKDINTIGSRIFEMEWQPEQAGQLCYLITWFLNNRGESGPESLPLMIPII